MRIWLPAYVMKDIESIKPEQMTHKDFVERIVIEFVNNNREENNESKYKRNK